MANIDDKAHLESRSVIQTVRKSYEFKKLHEKRMSNDPIRQFDIWMAQAFDAGVKEPNAMTLSTLNKKGYPNARIVLLRDFTENGFSFFTNYKSAKGKELASGKACLLFFWLEVARQVKILGTTETVPIAESDIYFSSRPRESQIAAWASDQSKTIPDRDYLEKRFSFFKKKFKDMEVPRPPHWGGFLIKPVQIEFWQGRENRLHDRILYTKQKGVWKLERLSP